MGKERKYGPNGIEWNEDRKCKVKGKEKRNHNTWWDPDSTPLLRPSPQGCEKWSVQDLVI